MYGCVWQLPLNQHDDDDDLRDAIAYSLRFATREFFTPFPGG